MFEVWLRTVFSEIHRDWAICLSLLPWARALMTSSSLSVRGGGRAGGFPTYADFRELYLPYWWVNEVIRSTPTRPPTSVSRLGGSSVLATGPPQRSRNRYGDSRRDKGQRDPDRYLAHEVRDYELHTHEDQDYREAQLKVDEGLHRHGDGRVRGHRRRDEHRGPRTTLPLGQDRRARRRREHGPLPGFRRVEVRNGCGVRR
jgi:hypothetical protein